ncbi:MAG: hypothetical protein FWB93_00420, partial [Oscillospiraceae bacterium]|nr:hypothetical protein [Oscillospiraceae bacterium]
MHRIYRRSKQFFSPWTFTCESLRLDTERNADCFLRFAVLFVVARRSGFVVADVPPNHPVLAENHCQSTPPREGNKVKDYLCS